MLKKIKIFVVFLSIITTSVFAKESNLALGIGAGIPYGVIGGSVNFSPSKQLVLTAGLGIGFGVGVRYYPFDNPFRLSLLYGTYGIIRTKIKDHSKTETFDNAAIGLGWGKVNGWDIDLIYILDKSKFDDRVAELKRLGFTREKEGGTTDSQVKLSFGYRWSLNEV